MSQDYAGGDGYRTLAPGKIVNAAVWLELMHRPELPPALALRRVLPSDYALCRALYRTIGTPWLWSRAYDLPVAPLLAGDGTLAIDVHFALDDDGGVAGVVEFDGRPGPEVEIPWFGLTPDATGRGLGRRMMAAALDLALPPGGRRAWLHTSSFDHPSALRFYRSCGFAVFKLGFEVMDDPRLTGHLPRDAAPQIPLAVVDWS